MFIQKKLIILTDLGMLLYWFIILMAAQNVLNIPPDYMYSDHTSPFMVYWNLSFLPIDIMFSVLGIASITLPLKDKLKENLNIISLTLMFCAGFMAISFWAIAGDFDPFWWGINLWLVILPIAIAAAAYIQSIKEVG